MRHDSIWAEKEIRDNMRFDVFWQLMLLLQFVMGTGLIPGKGLKQRVRAHRLAAQQRVRR